MFLITLEAIIIAGLIIYLFTLEKDFERILELVADQRSSAKKQCDYIHQLLDQIETKNKQLIELSADLHIAESKAKCSRKKQENSNVSK